MGHYRSRLLILVLVLGPLAPLPGLMAEPSAGKSEDKKVLIAIGPEKKQDLLDAFAEFNVTASLYPNVAGKRGADAFVADIRKASVLMLFHGSKTRLKELMATPAVMREMEAFLARGGAIFCDYKAAGNGNGFLKPLGAAPLARIAKSTLDYSAAVPAGPASPLKQIPEAYPWRCYGAWKGAPAKIKPLLVLENDKDASPLLMEKGVAGKGRIIYSQLLSFLQWTKGPRYKPRHEEKVRLLLDLMFKDG